jgi:hypothetical protein
VRSLFLTYRSSNFPLGMGNIKAPQGAFLLGTINIHVHENLLRSQPRRPRTLLQGEIKWQEV